jgi:hypothetical protein
MLKWGAFVQLILAFLINDMGHFRMPRILLASMRKIEKSVSDARNRVISAKISTNHKLSSVDCALKKAISRTNVRSVFAATVKTSSFSGLVVALDRWIFPRRLLVHYTIHIVLPETRQKSSV